MWRCHNQTTTHTGEFQNALQDLRHCLMLEPNDIEARYLQGVVHQEVTGLLAVFAPCVPPASLPFSLSCLPGAETNTVGTPQVRALDNAIYDFSTVLEMDPGHVKAAYARAACKNLKGEFAHAIGLPRPPPSLPRFSHGFSCSVNLSPALPSAADLI